ncbi:MAG: NRDE family protein [Balneola sp.]|nr:NRDE family protein [Balneola sp.]MBO6650065.1 NRDE family protein [Balneola sp.]MBO6711585.1 NRDE family protein [Balneola sp.]MBO6799781.1 NRDE family protein [Balneola sp.]MBO6870778.1 NRDE family protein [Balneola sp.]
MCLIAFSYKTHPRYKLIVAANRDEFYQRPTRKAQFWDEEDLPNILAGKDLKANGTWMGVSKTGKWGALTNFRDPSNIKDNAPTRGDLVLDFLKSGVSEQEYLQEIQTKAEEYNGFNLLIGDKDSVFHYSNENNLITEVKPGIHGVSNALLDTPWPKLAHAKKELKEITSKEDFSKEDLFKILANSETAPDDKLPSTGIPYEWEKAVSSIFIKTDNYGTLCSTLLLVDYDGNAEFTERRYDSSTSEIIEENTFKLVFS